MANTVSINLNDYESMMQELRFYKNVVDSIVHTVSASSWSLDYYKEGHTRHLNLTAQPSEYLSAPDKDRFNQMIHKAVTEYVASNHIDGEVRPNDISISICDIERVDESNADEE